MGYMTEERLMLKEMVAKFTDDVVLPIANELDPQKGKIPTDLIDQMSDLGLFGILTPEELGGSGLGAIEYCIVAEELSRGWMSVGSLIARAKYQLFEGMPQDWKDKNMENVLNGKYMSAMSLSEPNTGSDLSNIACRAEPDGDGYRLYGSKYWCTFADDADAIMVFARTEPKSENPKEAYKNISVFLVEKPRGELPEGCSGQPIPKIGYFGWNTFELSFDGTYVPGTHLVGEKGNAFKWVTHGLELARAHTAARSIGCAQGAYNCASEYAKERIQFGKPISQFQDIRFKLARAATEIEACRQLLYHACDKVDSGERADLETSMIKYYAAEMSERVCSDMMQVMGGAGYTTLYPVERYWRDARLTKIFEGTSEIQLRIISDRLLGK